MKRFLSKAPRSYWALSLLWVISVIALAVTPSGQGWLQQVHHLRVGMFTLGVFLLVLTWVSGFLYYYRVVHTLASVWLFSQATIYASLLGPASAGLTQYNGLVILLGLPVLAWIVLKAQRHHRFRMQAYQRTRAAIESGDYSEAILSLDALATRIGV